MGQEREPAPPPKNAPDLETIRKAWNLFADNANPMAAFMMQNGVLDMHGVAEVAEACTTVANFMAKAVQLHNDQVNAELQMRNEAEKKIRADLKGKGNAAANEEKETPAATVLNMRSVDNDPPAKAKPAPAKRNRTKPQKANVRKKPTQKKK